MPPGARDSLRGYYAARAREYESVYGKPERQADLVVLRGAVAGFALGRSVLEVACGTGYWTAELARTARSVVATDVGDEVLAVAGAKGLSPGVVRFVQADAFGLERVSGRFDAAFAGFWWSHVLRADRPRFLAGLHARLARPARVLLMDNRYVPGSSTPVSRRDAAGNTYQERRLGDGSTHEVLKNFPTPDELGSVLAGSGAQQIEVRETTYFWLASYEVAAGREEV